MTLFNANSSSADEPHELSIPSSESFLGPIDPKIIAAGIDEKWQFRYSNETFPKCRQYARYLKDIKSRMNIETLEYLASGTFGAVFIGKETNESRKRQRKYAIKVISAQYCGPNYLTAWHSNTKKELYFLSKLHHPNIVKVFDCLWLKSKISHSKPCHLVIKMEYLPLDLSDLLWFGDPLEHYLLNRMVLHVGSALEYMHHRGVAHHDLKPMNIMIRFPKNFYFDPDPYCHSQFVVIDLGLARQYIVPIDITKVVEDDFRDGSPKYFSPEKLDPNKSYNPFSADCFALGTVTLKCMVGKDNWPSNVHSVDYLRIAYEHIAGVGQPGPVHRVVQLLLSSENDRPSLDYIGKLMQ